MFRFYWNQTNSKYLLSDDKFWSVRFQNKNECRKNSTKEPFKEFLTIYFNFRIQYLTLRSSGGKKKHDEKILNKTERIQWMKCSALVNTILTNERNKKRERQNEALWYNCDSILISSFYKFAIRRMFLFRMVEFRLCGDYLCIRIYGMLTLQLVIYKISSVVVPLKVLSLIFAFFSSSYFACVYRCSIKASNC